ncbi:efflux RND transporter periplasmic adaptor subunit [Paenibacillus thiaminolyticus]|uniref:efflux RND transporter periplasmic adaptor subunit n=1 Tax=Paenibacillus thiaminolyticus TaxID=49283 RepID=UPI00232BEBB2|nr:efflux RND transporter periplasmic adaptor subunit [Paenibacillus thiaminolyticus]WCF08861.1 efflux RND transporter periplasmic adaptor subunit [Paenibacillus thiaminolyticus]
MDSKAVEGRMRRILLIAFVISLVLLTLFSNTIQSFTLPAVVTTAPETGQLKMTIEGEGKLRPADQIEVKNEKGLELARLAVKEGSRVNKGDIIAEYNNGTLERQIRDAEAQLQKSKINADKLKEQFIQARIAGDELQIREAERAIELDRIEQQIQSQQLADLREDLSNHRYERAPFGGIITEVKASVEDATSPGQTIAVLMREKDGYEFSFTLPEHEAKWLEEGESVDVQLTGKTGHRLNGAIHSIDIGDPQAPSTGTSVPGSDNSAGESAAGSAATVTIRIPAAAEGIKPESGMRAKISIEKKSEQTGFLIQSKWLKQDMDGTYLFLVKETLGAFGNEYIVYKAAVNVLADSGEQSLVQGLTSKDNIITETSEPLKEGNRVRVK